MQCRNLCKHFVPHLWVLTLRSDSVFMSITVKGDSLCEFSSAKYLYGHKTPANGGFMYRWGPSDLHAAVWCSVPHLRLGIHAYHCFQSGREGCYCSTSTSDTTLQQATLLETFPDCKVWSTSSHGHHCRLFLRLGVSWLLSTPDCVSSDLDSSWGLKTSPELTAVGPFCNRVKLGDDVVESSFCSWRFVPLESWNCEVFLSRTEEIIEVIVWIWECLWLG